jgi:hypothetical protein
VPAMARAPLRRKNLRLVCMVCLPFLLPFALRASLHSLGG